MMFPLCPPSEIMSEFIPRHFRFVYTMAVLAGVVAVADLLRPYSAKNEISEDHGPSLAIVGGGKRVNG
jgi:hypothetical protein